MRRFTLPMSQSYTPLFARSNLINPIMWLMKRDVLDLTFHIDGTYSDQTVFTESIGYKYEVYK